MAYRLCNPTPFEARIEWSPGVPIIIPPDSEVELTHEQGDDFRQDKPGTDAVLEITRPMGVFLRDDSRTYDVQALEALEHAAQLKKAEYNHRVDSLRKLKSEQGRVPDEETLKQLVEDHGLGRLMKEAEAYEKRAKIIRKAIGDVPVIVHKEYDPERTCFVLDTGPKEFPSKLAMQLFLDENPAIKKRHEAYMQEK